MQLLESPFPLLLLLLSIWSFARGRPFHMTICKRSVPVDHHLQEASPSDHHLQQAGPSFWQPRTGHKNCILETPHNDLKCVLSVTESNFNEKKIKIFTFAYSQGQGSWPSPPLYGQPNRKIYFGFIHLSNFIWCVFIFYHLYYNSMCSEMDFTPEKSCTIEKMGQNFHICLRSGPTGLTPPPLYGQPDRKISVFFNDFFPKSLGKKSTRNEG